MEADKTCAQNIKMLHMGTLDEVGPVEVHLLQGFPKNVVLSTPFSYATGWTPSGSRLTPQA